MFMLDYSSAYSKVEGINLMGNTQPDYIASEDFNLAHYGTLDENHANQLELAFNEAPGFNNFENKTLTLQQFNPSDPNVAYPVYDVRKEIHYNSGIVPIADVPSGTYDPEVPYAHGAIHFNRNLADFNNDGHVDSLDEKILLSEYGKGTYEAPVKSLADIAISNPAGGIALPGSTTPYFDGVVDWADAQAFFAASGDVGSGLYISAKSRLGTSTVLCRHISGAQESADNFDVPYIGPLGDEKVHFYSWNPLTMPTTNARLQTDARPHDSMSTYKLVFEGENLGGPMNGVEPCIYFANIGDTARNNILASIYDLRYDREFGRYYWELYETYDAKEAAKYPSESMTSCFVENRLSGLIEIKYFVPEDVNFDNKVDLNDFAQLSQYWGTTFDPETRDIYAPLMIPEVYTDINNDGKVGLEDLAALSEYWLWQKPVYEIDSYDPIDAPGGKSEI